MVPHSYMTSRAIITFRRRLDSNVSVADYNNSFVDSFGHFFAGFYSAFSFII